MIKYVVFFLTNHRSCKLVSKVASHGPQSGLNTRTGFVVHPTGLEIYLIEMNIKPTNCVQVFYVWLY